MTNAYLLCRIADTLEDEPALSAGQKRHLQERFLAVLRVEEAAEDFARQVTPLLSPATTPEERALMANTPRVVRCTHGLAPPQRQALIQCVSIMCRGMGHYQANASREGLADLGEVDRYCYHVAGVVGEMLTELFCQYSDDMHERRGEMLALAPRLARGCSSPISSRISGTIGSAASAGCPDRSSRRSAWTWRAWHRDVTIPPSSPHWATW